ncbi:class I SAM-dependent methyltransferase [Streptomyces benahoarensis]|uniref:Class I SAM-dependent methyltransferase n=1 Tax=Streptomyces benahoarensis TaxID=2595054 RepID=A0A553ZQW2_9ACTN|nr:class I SAM-dependent methyltransferase [Streptomyces benahoarensis]TSB32805.1 class I SAM-dependent methyltransferase [Streptomyces benahoarensis]TSB43868.1 class I SAM-dependent methyltransferase [Streptomyces benahoarensis]
MATSATQCLYETFPFPTPGVDRPLIDVVADEIPLVIEGGPADGWSVLDAGCGTGHTLVGLARAYPRVHFTGLEPSAAARDIARRLARRHGVTNVDIVDGALPDAALDRRFDFIYSYGVIHHLPDPHAGLAWLGEHLADDGLLHLWLYHAIGEAQRMRDRELVRLLGAHEDAPGLDVVRALGLSLSLDAYGMPGAWAGTALDQREQDVFDADAYLNPVVHTLRFADLPRLLDGVTDWIAADRLYGPHGAPYLDLSGTGGLPPHGPELLRPEDLFDDPGLRRRIDALDHLDRLRAVELVQRPTGFRALAGRGAALHRCTRRIAGNLLPGAAPGA